MHEHEPYRPAPKYRRGRLEWASHKFGPDGRFQRGSIPRRNESVYRKRMKGEKDQIDDDDKLDSDDERCGERRI
jgi:hypothetical protein